MLYGLGTDEARFNYQPQGGRRPLNLTPAEDLDVLFQPLAV